MDTQEFLGCKVALIHARSVLVYERDEHVKHARMWDLPGGGRKGRESPEECVIREVEEEFGLHLATEQLEYRRRHNSAHSDSYAFFFVGKLSEREVARIGFGAEGRRWRLMGIDEYLNHPEALPHHKFWLREYLASEAAGAA